MKTTKSLRSRLTPPAIIVLGLCTLLGTLCASGIPVIDGANLANNTINQIATLAKWVDSIAQLKAQIQHMRTQIDLQTNLRDWSGDPSKAATSIVLDILKEGDLTRDYGRVRDAVTRTADSLAVLREDDSGTYRLLETTDVTGQNISHDPLLYRRFSTLDARQANTRTVIDATHERERELLEEITLTTAELRTANTDALVQKLSAKLSVLNGQLAQVENVRRREVDEVLLQQVANDARREVEQIAATEMRAKDEHVMGQLMTGFMRSLNPNKGRVD